MAEEASGQAVKGEKRFFRQTKGEEVLQVQGVAPEKTWQLPRVGLKWSFHSGFSCLSDTCSL